MMIKQKFTGRFVDMRQVIALVVAVGALVVAATPVLGHHSFAAEFDSSKTVSFSGIVTKVEWLNPHVYFYVDVKDSKTGKVTNWGCEMGSPNGLARQGWTRNTLKIGMLVNVEGSQAKDGSSIANARNVTVDGKKLGAASSETATNP